MKPKCKKPCKADCVAEVPSIKIGNQPTINCPCLFCIVKAICTEECEDMRMYIHIVSNKIVETGCEIKITENGMVIKYN